MSDNYALDKQMERLQQEVAELRATDQRLMASIVRHSDEIADLLEELRSQRDQLAAALERPAAATADPVCGDPSCDPKTCMRAYCPVTDGVGAGLTPAQPAPPEGIDVERVMALVDELERDARKAKWSPIHRVEFDGTIGRLRALLGGAR